MQLQEQLEIINLKTFIMKDKHIFQKLEKKWLLSHILDCQGKKRMI
ncbi:hypothetical protein IIV6-T1_291 [Invertebrate iridescent virus 6]|nr:hypothetical protein IIV6-T1_291 [Invertebrate iridescent virus 6]